MVSRLVVIVHVLKVQNAPRPVRFGRVNTHLGASSCHQYGVDGECVPPRRLELRRRPVVQVHITILVVRLGNAAFKGFLFLQVLTNTVERKTSARKEKLFGLMTRVNGRGRLIPTPAPNNIMLHRGGGGFGGPLVNRLLYYTINPQCQCQCQIEPTLLARSRR